jgi:hypothetical protein
MDAQELARKFKSRVNAAATEKTRQNAVASDNSQKRQDDVEHCKRAMANHGIPFFKALQHHLGEEQFSFAMQVDLDHKPVGVSFRIGDGGTTSISTAFGNIVVTQTGASGSSKGQSHVYSPDAEPYISNSGDLTREKMAKLVDMIIESTPS